MTIVFRSQNDAVRAAREAIWGDVPYAQRECVTPRTHPEFGEYIQGVPYMVVSANVNGRLVAIHFDAYGRLDSTGVKVVGKVEKQER